MRPAALRRGAAVKAMLLKRISAAFLLGVQHGVGRRYVCRRLVVIRHNDIHVAAEGIDNVVGGNTAVYRNQHICMLVLQMLYGVLV